MSDIFGPLLSAATVFISLPFPFLLASSLKLITQLGDKWKQ